MIPDRVYLSGSEAVHSAASMISSAAKEMSDAARNMSYTVGHLEGILRNFLDDFRLEVDRLAHAQFKPSVEIK